MSTPTLAPAGERLQAVDLLRGVIMVLMAIDHVRVYSGLPAGGSDAGIFVTRWITHFCAPGFVFLAGTSAYLYGNKVGDKGKLASFLLTRGILLVILEMTLIRFLWSFNTNLTDFILAGVIWMIGWCMVIMAALIWMRPVVVGWIGLAIILGQQLFALIPRVMTDDTSRFTRFWEFIYSSGFDGPESITILYVIVPWIGVMAAGYGFGIILKMEPSRRNKLCRWIGLGAIALFLIGAIASAMMNTEDTRPLIYRVLDQRKYPASQLYLLMTLGPLIALIPVAERLKGKLTRAVEVFGKVPFFYYVSHILVIHLSALVVNSVLTGNAHNEWYLIAPYVWIEQQEYWWSLGLLYIVFAVDVILLYFPCRWYADYKAKGGRAWTKYL